MSAYCDDGYLILRTSRSLGEYVDEPANKAQRVWLPDTCRCEPASGAPRVGL